MGRALGNPFELNLVVVTGPRNGCPECDPIVGKVFSISGLDGHYTALSILWTAGHLFMTIAATTFRLLCKLRLRSRLAASAHEPSRDGRYGR